jgi:hypothetical protein
MHVNVFRKLEWTSTVSFLGNPLSWHPGIQGCWLGEVLLQFYLWIDQPMQKLKQLTF